MTETDATFAPIIATLHEGRQVVREQLQRIDEREAIDWPFLELLQQTTTELGDQAEALLAIMMLRGADKAAMLSAQELVLFFTHTSVHMMLRLGHPEAVASLG
jgi:hypothetical protein